jgi:hypothetical protein
MIGGDLMRDCCTGPAIVNIQKVVDERVRFSDIPLAQTKASVFGPKTLLAL